MDNLINAHRNARKDKSYYREVQMVDSNMEKYLTNIQHMLINKTYSIKDTDYTFSVINDKGKKRELAKLPYYPHRIIQWAIMLQIEPIFNKVFTNFTCASIPNRGIKLAHTLTKSYLTDTENTKYCLKFDVHHFYPSVNHQILKNLLRKKFKDKDLLQLLDMIINSHSPVGIPIGSYLSQYFANFYLSYFDYWLKENLHAKYVVRYMDDVIILDNSKEKLSYFLSEIISYLKNNLDLTLKGNYQIFPVNSRGIDFVGYRFFHNYILLRKSTCKRMKHKMRKIYKNIVLYHYINYHDFCVVNSYSGWLLFCDSFRLYSKYIKPINNYINRDEVNENERYGKS
jgi:hypothetical protein